MAKEKISNGDSKSLWNFSLSPGWTVAEVSILKLALQKFGIGKWKSIIKSGCLPKKSIGQIYLQTQKLIGQQSLGDYMGLHIDIEKVFSKNISKEKVLRKSNCIVNTGDNPTRKQREEKIEQNRKEYGLSEAEVRNIKLPKNKYAKFKELMSLPEIEKCKVTTIEKINLLSDLKKAVDYKIDYITKYGNDKFLNSEFNKIKLEILSNSKKKNVLSKRIRKLRREDYEGESELSSESSENYDDIIVKVKKINNKEYTITDIVL